MSTIEMTLESLLEEYRRQPMGSLEISDLYDLVDDCRRQYPNYDKAGIYKFWNADHELIYVGRADNLGYRIGEHLRLNRERTALVPKDPAWWLEAGRGLPRYLRTVATVTPDESWKLECFLIRKLNPPRNKANMKRWKALQADLRPRSITASAPTDAATEDAELIALCEQFIVTANLLFGTHEPWNDKTHLPRLREIGTAIMDTPTATMQGLATKARIAHFAQYSGVWFWVDPKCGQPRFPFAMSLVADLSGGCDPEVDVQCA